jgi:signal transduction histidine kinase/ActR/RegA family two-component response regulator
MLGGVMQFRDAAAVRRRLTPLSLRAHLVLLVLGALLPVLVFAALLVVMLSRQQREAVEHGLQETTRALSLAVDQYLETAISSLVVLASSEHLETPDLARFQAQAALAVSSQDGWRSIQLISPRGEVQMDTARVAPSARPPLDDPQFVDQVVAAGIARVSDLVAADGASPPGVRIGVPVLRPRGGPVRSVLVAAIDPSVFSRLLAQQQLPPEWTGEVVDRGGLIIARSRDADRLVGAPGAARLVQRSRETAEGAYQHGDEQEAVKGRFSRSRVAGWTVALSVPAATLRSTTHVAMLTTLGGGLALLLIALGLAALLGRRIATPIVALSGSAAALGRGEPPPPLAAPIAEVADVARSLVEAGERNAQLLAETRQRHHEAELIATLARSINAALDLDTVLQRLVDGARDVCRSDIAAILLREPAGEAAVPRYRAGAPRSPRYDALRVEPGKGAGGQVLLTGQPFRTADYARDPRVSADYRAIVDEEGIVSLMVVPIRIGDRVEGLIYVDNRAPRVFTERDETVVLQLAEQAAVAIRNAELLRAERGSRAEVEASRGRLEFLAHAHAVLTASLDLGTTLASLVRLAVPRLADLCAVDLVEGETAVRRAAVAHVDPEHERLLRALPEHAALDATAGVLGHVLGSGEAELVPAIAGGDRAILGPAWRRAGTLPALAVSSAMVVPLRARDRVLGAITFARGPGGPAYTSVDLDLAQDLARRAALAMDNARLYGQAEDANRAKDDFLATLSHELRTPLTAIMGWLRMLSQGQLDGPTTERALAVIDRNVRLQARLIDDLLDVSRIIAGKLSLDHRPVDLIGVVEAALESVEQAARAKGVTLARALSPDAGAVWGDASRLQQVVWNLLTNAIRFTPAGGRVEVALERADPCVELRVRDTGQGISAELLPHVFERFRQADTGMTRGHGGLGLGLAIVRHLVERHHGQVEAQSEGIGRGATFTIRLPVMAVRLPAGDGLGPGGAAPAGAPAELPDLHRLRVLVVDDEPDARDVVAAVLRRCKAEVAVASTAAEALRALDEFAPDVLVSDLAMPREDGYQLIRRIRRRPAERGGRTPAVALTAYSSAEERQRGLAAGFDAHAAKPIDPAELARIVARLAARAVSPP